MLKGKKVKSNDGKEVGDIKEVSQNFLRIEKGTVKKDKFWIPKYVADAYDGKTLWLLINEEETVYRADSDQNVSVVTDYKNVRDSHNMYIHRYSLN